MREKKSEAQERQKDKQGGDTEKKKQQDDRKCETKSIFWKRGKEKKKEKEREGRDSNPRTRRTAT